MKARFVAKFIMACGRNFLLQKLFGYLNTNEIFLTHSAAFF